MKKFRYLSLILSVVLLFQCAVLPARAEMLPTETEPTEEVQQVLPTEKTDIPFGSVCIEKGCRTINGQAPLAGTERKLETAQSVFLYEYKTDTVVYAYNPDLKIHPGTLAKIVMALIVIENCNMDDIVTVTEGIQSYVPMGVNKVQSESL